MDQQAEAMSKLMLIQFNSHESWLLADKAPTNLCFHMSLNSLVGTISTFGNFKWKTNSMSPQAADITWLKRVTQFIVIRQTHWTSSCQDYSPTSFGLSPLDECLQFTRTQNVIKTINSVRFRVLFKLKIIQKVHLISAKSILKVFFY
jgi:hypothetical protein